MSNPAKFISAMVAQLVRASMLSVAVASTMPQVTMKNRIDEITNTLLKKPLFQNSNIATSHLDRKSTPDKDKHQYAHE